MISNIAILRFLTIFKGNTSFYNKNELPKVKPEGGKFKTKIITVKEKLTKEEIARHLDGEIGIGISPITNDNKVFYAVLDIDCYDKRLDKMLGFIREYNLPLIPFHSKSGGLHVYIFFTKAVSARSARELLENIIYYFSLEDIYGKGKVEIFPKQTDLKEGSCGSCLCLPYFNAEKTYNSMLDCDKNTYSLEEALDYIQQHMTTLDAMKKLLEDLPFSDSPPCLQKILLAHLVGSEDSGRNNFLFSFAVYAKKKYGNGFESYVQEVNNSFECPLEDAVINQICNSVNNNEYYYKCKELGSYCDKVHCKKREFGLGINENGKSHFTGVEFGTLTRVLSAEPYYKWLLRLQGTEEWKECIFKDEAYLLDQKNFQKVCLRYLNYAPRNVSPNDWNSTLNIVLPNIKTEVIKQESDTSGLSVIRNAFINYLSNKQARRECPYQIKVGLCVRQVNNGQAKYFFTHKGFSDYLRNQKISFDCNMLRETLKNFGAVEDVLQYTNAFGEIMHFPCWSKLEDKDIDEAYLEAMEIENGDKANMGVIGVSEASNVNMPEPKSEGEKPYTEEDMKNAQDLF